MQLTRKQIIGIKTEVVQNTPVALVSTDYTYATNIVVNPKVEMAPQEYLSTSLSGFKSLPGKKFYEIEFTLPMKTAALPGSGTPDLPLDAALQACGMVGQYPDAIFYNFTSNKVANFDTLGKSATIKVYQDGELHQIAGTVLDCSIEAVVGNIVFAKFKGMGKFSDVTDAAFPAITPSNNDPYVFQGGAFTRGGVSMFISKLSLEFGNKITMRDDVNDVHGIKGFVITGREVKGSFDPEKLSVATYAFLNKMKTGEEAALSVYWGSGQDIIIITAPKTQMIDVKTGDRNGIATYDVPIRFNRNTGDDELIIQMYDV